MIGEYDFKEIKSNLLGLNISPFLFKLYSKVFSLIPHKGSKVIDEDWDYLIVLDACRYDIFEDINTIPGDLQKRISVGGTSSEWLNRNFDSYYEDLVYISANPRVSATELEGTIDPSERFADYYLPYLEDKYKELGVTRPEGVSKCAKEALSDHSDKRLIIHYMQPHAPYIGDKRLGKGSIYELYSSGVEREEIVEAYRSNLKLVLSEIKSLLEVLQGKVVITADHGEMLGEKGVYGHGNLHFKELVEVPWLVIEAEGEKESLGNKESMSQENYNEDQIKNQLKDLGYNF